MYVCIYEFAPVRKPLFNIFFSVNVFTLNIKLFFILLVISEKNNYYIIIPSFMEYS